MNILSGFLNPLNMYISISNMDDDHAKKKATKIITVVAILSFILSVLPVLVANVDIESYIVAITVSNLELMSFLILLPIVASWLSNLYSKKTQDSGKSTNFSKTFLILTTSQAYIYVASIIIVLEVSALISCASLHIPKWLFMMVMGVSMIAVIAQTILALIWYVYKPYSAIYQNPDKSKLKRISLVIMSYSAAFIACQTIEASAGYQFGTSVIATNGTLGTDTPSKVIKNSETVYPTHIETIDTRSLEK